MTCRVGIVITMLLATGGTQSATGQSETGTVTINVVDPFGKPLPYKVGSFTYRNTGHEYSQQFTLLKGTGLPRGVYQYRLDRIGAPAGTYTLSGEIYVLAANVHKTLIGAGPLTLIEGHAASVSIRKPKDFKIEGCVFPSSASKSLWIRFQHVYQEHSLEVPVDERGSFIITEILEGAYLALLFDGHVLIDVRPVSFAQGTASAKFEIKLTDGSLNTIIVSGPKTTPNERREAKP